MFRILAGLTAVLALLNVGTAAPIPKLPPPPKPKTNAEVVLMVGKIEGKKLTIIESVPVLESVSVPVTITEVVEGRAVTVTRLAVQTVSRIVVTSTLYELDSLKATDSLGKEIDSGNLETRLKAKAPLARIGKDFDPEWRKFFTDDVVFIELVPHPELKPGALPPAAPAIPPPVIEKK